MLRPILYLSVFCVLKKWELSEATINFDAKSQYEIFFQNDSGFIHALPIINYPAHETTTAIDTTSVRPHVTMREIKTIQQIIKAINSLQTQTVILLMSTDKDTYESANVYIRNIIRSPKLKTEFRLMIFNSSGVTESVADTTTGTTNFINLLEKIIYQQSQTSQIVPETFQGSTVFYGILKASHALPEGSGIIVFNERRIEDEDLAQLAVNEMRSRKIKLFVIWTDVHPTIKQEEKLLREAALATGGEFFIGNGEKKHEPYSNYDSLFNNVVAMYLNVTGTERIEFPVDTTVRNIHISITFPVIASLLTSPNGYLIDVLNNTAVERFSVGSSSSFQADTKQHEIHLNTAGYVLTPVVGIWRLDVIGSGVRAQGCNVTISVQTKLNVTATITYNNYGQETGHKVLRLKVSDKIRRIKDISFIDAQGSYIDEKVTFMSPEHHQAQTIANNTSVSLQEVDINFNDIPEGSFYVKISGEDQNGSTFSRLSYFDRNDGNYISESLSIEVGANSELLVMPNQYGKIFFEVTNNRDEVVNLNFLVRDERSFLWRMEPQYSWINPRQSVVVTVTVVGSRPSQNLITFTVSGSHTARKSALMYVTTVTNTDYTTPYLNHKFKSDCTENLLRKCEDGSWVVEVTAQDRESGLLQLTSSPKGLYFPNGYIAGTKELVTGIYGGSCCQPKLQLIATDLRNNRNSYTIDAYKTALSPAAISAIVLGVLLFILILILLICLCRKKCGKSKQSVDLPTYRRPHDNSRL